MTEFSMLWETQTGTGDGAFSYTQDQSNNYFRYFDSQSPDTQGVAFNGGGLNSLEITGTAIPLNVASGAAICWLRYWNDAATTVTTTPPPIDTGGRVILSTDWSTNECRLEIILSGPGITTPPSLTQAVGVRWQISLATFVMDSVGNVFTDSGKLTAGTLDSRHFLISPAAGMIKLREQTVVGSSVIFANIQDDLTHLRIIINATGSGAGGSVGYIDMKINDSTQSGGYSSMSTEIKSTPSNVTTSAFGGSLFHKAAMINDAYPNRVNSGSAVIDIPNYSLIDGSNRYVTFMSNSVADIGGLLFQLQSVGSVLETGNLAVHEIKLEPNTTEIFGGRFSASLYGIK